MFCSDFAIMNERNEVNIVGRAKDMIIRGGENVYPTEIEQLLYKHEHIEDVHVVKVSCHIPRIHYTLRRWACQMIAWVRRFALGCDCITMRRQVSRPSQYASGARARLFLFSLGKLYYAKPKQMAHFKVPRYVAIKAEGDFPLTVTGKVQKFRIRDMAAKELGLGVGDVKFA